MLVSTWPAVMGQSGEAIRAEPGWMADEQAIALPNTPPSQNNHIPREKHSQIHFIP